MQSTTIPAAYNPAGYTAAQVKQTINHTGNSTISRIRNRYQLLQLDPAGSKTLVPVKLARPGPTGDWADISYCVDSCKVNMDTSKAVPRWADITLRERPDLQMDALNHYIRPFVGYYDQHWNLLFEVPVGTFRIYLGERTIAPSARSVTLNCQGVISHVSDVGFMNSYCVPAASDQFAIISSLLQIDYKPKSRGGTGQNANGLDLVGANFPASRINLPIRNDLNPVPPLTGTSTLWGRDANQLAKINELLDTISFYGIWDDAWGDICFTPRPYVANVPPPISWAYHTDSSSVIIPGSVKQSFAVQNLANLIVLYSENNQAAPIVSIRWNDKPGSSLISTANYPHTIQKTINDSKIPNQAAADQRAGAEAQLADRLVETVTFDTWINPLHEAHDVLDLQITDENGNVTINGAPYGFEEISWSMDLDKRTMSHTAQKLNLV